MTVRRLLRLVAGLAIVGTVVIFTATAAFAHAILQSTDPVADSTVAQSPPHISLTFNENVTVSIGGIRLLNCTGGRITVGTPQHAPTSDHTVIVGDVPTLKPGTYVVTWRVISADSHPVNGAFTFTVGGVAAQGLSACKTGVAPTSSKTVGVLFGADRVMLYAGLALLIGGVVFLFVIARGTSAVRQTRRIVWVGWGLTTAATIFGVMLQGPYAEGSGIGDATNSTVLKDILKTQYGHVAERRLLLLAIAFVLLVFVSRLRENERPPAWLWVSCGVVGALIAATPGLAGHAGTGSEVWAAVPLDTVHVAAMSIWFGGLFCLLVVALGGGFSGGLRRAISAFSLLALWCVIALVLSGLFAAWRQVGFTIKGYTSTTYGHLLLIKLGIVVAILALAAVSRAIVRRRQAAPLDAPDSAVAAIDERTVHGLRRSVAGEVAVGIAVLIVTAILVNAQPARSQLVSGPVAKTVKAGSGSDSMLVNIIVDPARVGKNAVHIYTLTPQGGTLASRISAQLRNVKQGIAPINIDLAKAGPNHSTTSDLVIPTPGTWQFIVHALRGTDDDTAVTIDVPIRR